MKKQIIFFTFFSLYQCQILTPEEDAERASKCGKVMQTKVLAGMSAEDSAPWTLRVTVKSGDKSTPDPFFSSILVSDRHVLTAGLSVIVGRKLYTEFSKANTFISRRMDLPEEILKSMRVQLSLCQDVDKCGTKISRAVTKGYYLGSCESGLQPFGMVLLEMSLAVPFEEPFYFVPACVYSTGAHEDDDVVFHTAGAPIGNKKNELIKATETKKEAECPKHLSWKKYNQQRGEESANYLTPSDG
uniref:Uncharacterized protein n=1 Tax=Caenorhabditis japonica TaxID=281687 RepID=A0A8R1DLR1_CAEJA